MISRLVLIRYGFRCGSDLAGVVGRPRPQIPGQAVTWAAEFDADTAGGDHG